MSNECYPFPKSMRLRTRQEYRRMGQKTFKFTGQWILADIRITHDPFCKLGITVTKRYGDAHRRNRFKRLVRDAFRLSYPHFPMKFDIVIRPRSQALQATMQDIQQELLQFVEEALNRKDQKDIKDQKEISDKGQ